LPVVSLRKYTWKRKFPAKNLSPGKSTAIFTTIPSPPNILVMKKPIFLTILLALFISASSQDVIRQQSCTNDMITKQVDSLKTLYGGQGYVLLKEASISMESEFEMPVIVPLTEGSWYQFVFIGDYTSRLYEVRMYDWQERMVIFRQKKWGDIDGNVIVYSYVPKFSEFHMMKPLQVNKQKKKNLCGYVMLFKRTGPETGSESPASK
jgi:hypothetical protein